MIDNIIGAVRSAVPDASRGEVEAVLADIDVDGLRSAAEGRYTVSKWNKTSPINGVPAEDVLEANPSFNETEIVLVSENGQIVMLQPTVPGTNDPIGSGQVSQVGETLVTSLVDGAVGAEVLDQVIDAVTEARASRASDLQGQIDGLTDFILSL